MKQLSYELIPTRLGFGNSFTDQITFLEEEYSTAENRKILIYNECISHYKLKSNTAMAFLEFYALDLKIGDVIDVRFEVKTDKNVVIGLEQNKINEDLSVSNAVTDNIDIVADENFKKYNIRSYMRNNYKDGIGDCFNLRLRTLDSEIEIRNIKITILSTNLNLAINNSIIKIKEKEEFEFATKYTMTQTKYRTDSYSKGLENLSSYATFGENKITLKSSDATYFKGVISKVEKIKQACVNIFFEYSSKNEFKVNLRCTNSGLSRESIYKFIEPSSNIIKKIIVLNGDLMKKKEYVVEIGDVRAVDLELKNIIINVFYVGSKEKKNILYSINY